MTLLKRMRKVLSEEGTLGRLTDTSPRIIMPRRGESTIKERMTQMLLTTSLTQCMQDHQGDPQDPPELALDLQETTEESRETTVEPGTEDPTRCLQAQEEGRAEDRAKTEQGMSPDPGEGRSNLHPQQGDSSTGAKEKEGGKIPGEQGHDFN